MNKSELMREVGRLLPAIEKPSNDELTVGGFSDFLSERLISELQGTIGDISPDSIRDISDQLSLFSAKGFRWMIPSYLLCALSSREKNDTVVEFFIYYLANEDLNQEKITALSLLDDRQISLISNILNYWNMDDFWGSYAGGELADAIEFLNGLLLFRNRGRWS